MSPLQSRKQLLLAESELNRAQLAAEFSALKSGVRLITERAQSFGAIASSAAVLLTGLAAFQRGPPATAGGKSSWLQTLLKGAGFISSLWLALRPPGPKTDEA